MTDLLKRLREGVWDWAKIGAVFYVLGLLITSIYFLRFSILSLDLLRPQSIIVGLYFAALYFALPILFLVVLRPVRSDVRVLTAFIVLLVTKDLALCRLIEGSLGAATVLVILQICLFIGIDRDRTKRPYKWSLYFKLFPVGRIELAVASLLLVVFASTTFGDIPGYFGGGHPISVHVFTRTPELPANRFMQTRNRPQVNRAMTSFRLNLLYESEDYFYFVAESKRNMTGYSIMKLQRTEVLRVDYITPVWFSAGGDQ